MFDRAICESPVIEFTVGQGVKQKTMTAHQEALSRLSPFFEAKLSERWSDASHKTKDFEKIDPDDFTRLCQFAYIGDYGVDVGPSLVANPEDNMKSKNSGLSKKKKLDLKRAKMDALHYQDEYISQSDSNPETKLQNRFKLRSFPQTKPEMDLNRVCHAFMNISTADANATSVALLAHARLYRIASVYMIDDLKTLALRKLHKTLSQSFSFSQGSIAALLRFVYGYDDEEKAPVHQELDRAVSHEGVDTAVEQGRNEGKANQDDPFTPTFRDDPLRELVMAYMICNYRRFSTYEKILALVNQGGEFATDLIQMINENYLVTG